MISVWLKPLSHDAARGVLGIALKDWALHLGHKTSDRADYRSTETSGRALRRGLRPRRTFVLRTPKSPMALGFYSIPARDEIMAPRVGHESDWSLSGIE